MGGGIVKWVPLLFMAAPVYKCMYIVATYKHIVAMYKYMYIVATYKYIAQSNVDCSFQSGHLYSKKRRKCTRTGAPSYLKMAFSPTAVLVDHIITSNNTMVI